MNHNSHSADNRTIDRTIAGQAPYTAVQLGEQLGVSEATIRNRWFAWIVKVAPEPLLKEGKGYTELARSLLSEFSQVARNQRDRWVEDAKARYSQEWSSAGVIEGELMPDNVGNALAFLQTNNTGQNAILATELAELDAFIEQVNAVEADFTEAELRTFRATGARRGIQRFKLETQAELETLNRLRQKRMEG